MTRQTICAKALIHVDVLAIECARFNNIVAKFPEIKRKLKRALFLNTEYILPTAIASSYAIHESEQPDELGKGFVNTLKYFLISTDNLWFRSYNYVVNVHIATLSSLLIATMIVRVGELDIAKYYHYMHILDFIFAFKIIIGFHQSYVDPESGVQVRIFSSIWHRYIGSGSGFWLDLFTCLPFEVLTTIFDMGLDWYRWLWFNRTFRFVFMMKYYTNCKNTLIVSKHLRWSYLMYILLVMLQLMIILW